MACVAGTPLTELKDIVRDAILRAPGISGARVELEVAQSGTVGGFVISDGFAGLTQIERQDLLWDHFDDTLSADVRAQVVMLLTMTPDEVRDDESIDAAE